MKTRQKRPLLFRRPPAAALARIFACRGLLAACAMLVSALQPFSPSAFSAAPPWRASPRASVMVNGGAMMNGDHFRDTILPLMKQHFAGARRIALILWATHPDDRDRMEKRLQSAFADLGPGITATSLHHLDDKAARQFLATADGIFVGGGETFVLLCELYRGGQIDLIRKRVVDDGVPYFGVSAGANVAGLDIGTTNDFPTREIPSRVALGLLPVTINPHHPEAADKDNFNARAGKIRAYLRFNPAETVLALGNTATIRLRAGVCTVELGPVWLYRAGQVAECPLGSTINFANPPAPAAPTAAPPPPTPPAAPAATVSQISAPQPREKLGWRDIPPLQARVVDWVSANSFQLDNGQVWEGEENIPYELKGKAITISARPLGTFVLSVEGKNTTIRVRRLK